MTEFKMNKSREEKLFEDVNLLLKQRRERSVKKSFSSKADGYKKAIKKSLTFDINLTHILIPAIVAVFVILLIPTKTEYYDDFIDLGTTVLTPEIEEEQ